MSLLQQALRAGHRASRPAANPGLCVLVAGAAGALGSAVLEQALVAFGRVQVLVDAPMAAAMRGFEALPRAALETGAGLLHADTALVVFDRERGRHGREAGFHQPQPQDLPVLAGLLHDHGVRHLVVVLPHAPALMPAAFKVGLASLDEQAVASLGFEQLVIVRSARPAPQRRAASWPQRLADAMLAQLHWMVPQRDQPVRPVKVAAFVVSVARHLPQARRGARVAPPELVWQAAQQRDAGNVVRRWLDEGQWQEGPVPAGRW
jgi:hypothetical protein